MAVFGRYVLALFATLLPVVAMAAPWSPGMPLVPCTNTCGFEDLVQLAQNLITFALWLAVPVSIILFAWAGFLWMTARDNAAQVKKAIGVFTDVIKGVLIMGAAWLLVYTSLNTLLSEEYKSRIRTLPPVTSPTP